MINELNPGDTRAGELPLPDTGDTGSAEPPLPDPGDTAGGEPSRAGRSVLRGVLASVAVTGVCAGAAAFFAGPAHVQHQQKPRAAQSIDHGDHLGAPPPWPDAQLPMSPPSGAAETTPDTGTGGKSPAAADNPDGAPASPGSAHHTSGQNGAADPGNTPETPPKASPHSTPDTSAPAPSSPKPSGPITVTGQISCSSGKSVVGVWVEAAQGHGWSPWKLVGNGENADYWYTLPTQETYSLHIGCGGTKSSWAVATETPYVGGTHNSFNCFDVPGKLGYGTCSHR